MPGGRPTKPLALVKGHRTKSEIEVRKKSEQELLTGSSLKEWAEVKADPIAHKEFSRTKKLLKSIKHDDDLYGFVINTQCKLKAEEFRMLENKQMFEQNLERLQDEYDPNDKDGMSFSEFAKLTVSIQGQILKCDDAIMKKRKLMLDISKENIMTIQSALRSIPKKETEKPNSAMSAFLAKRQAGNG